jgi:hypothetical protein
MIPYSTPSTFTCSCTVAHRMLVSAYSLCPVRKPSGVIRVGSSLVRTRVDYTIEEDNANATIGFVAETATFISE